MGLINCHRHYTSRKRRLKQKLFPLLATQNGLWSAVEQSVVAFRDVLYTGKELLFDSFVPTENTSGDATLLEATDLVIHQRHKGRDD